MVLPLVALALGLIGFTYEASFNESALHFTNEELVRETSPVWLFSLLTWIGRLALVIMLITPVLGDGEPFSGDQSLRALVFGSLALIVALVVKIVVFSPHAVLLYLAVAACDVLLVASALERSRRSLAGTHEFGPGRGLGLGDDAEPES